MTRAGQGNYDKAIEDLGYVAKRDPENGLRLEKRINDITKDRMMESAASIQYAVQQLTKPSQVVVYKGFVVLPDDIVE